MNEIFEKLMYSKIERFVHDYANLSRSVFVNTKGNLIHPGEFGMYREQIVKELLKPFLPEKFDIGTGFIITSKNRISTQCDLIIYDRENSPIIENAEQRFFPVECVVGVIEIKSNLSKSDFKKAVSKLSKIKKLRRDIEKNNPYIFRDHDVEEFDPVRNPRDQLATFLICEGLTFDVGKCKDEVINEIYKDVDKSLFHNMILSLNDGVFLYYDGEGKVIHIPYFDYNNEAFRHVIIKPSDEGYENEHILLFLNYFYMLISSLSVMYIEITKYLSASRKKSGVW